MTSVVRRATYQDVLDASPLMIAEILDGTLYTKPIEGMRRYSALHLASILGRHFRRNESGPGPWVFLLKPELHLGNGPDILVPDLAGWHRERLAGLPHDAPWTTIAPDWVCELLLPSGVAIDRGLKMDIYLREQVRHVWLIDPLALNLEIFRHGGDLWHRVAFHTGNITVRAEPFDAIELPLQWLWEP